MDYWHKDWQCPYFAWSDKKKIACEGKTQIVFPSDKSLQMYAQTHCANITGYHKCTVAAMLAEFYENEGGDNN